MQNVGGHAQATGILRQREERRVEPIDERPEERPGTVLRRRAVEVTAPDPAPGGALRHQAGGRNVVDEYQVGAEIEFLRVRLVRLDVALEAGLREHPLAALEPRLEPPRRRAARGVARGY